MFFTFFQEMNYRENKVVSNTDKVCKFTVSGLNSCLLWFQAKADWFNGIKFQGHKTNLLALPVSFQA